MTATEIDVERYANMPSIGDIIDSSAELLRIATADRFCVRCGLIYHEGANIGHWKCKKYHPFFAFAMPNDLTYKCCDRRIDPMVDGCVAADHIDIDIERTEPTKIAPHTVALFGECRITATNTYTDPNTGIMLVNRFDTRQQRRRTHPTMLVSDKTALLIQKKLATRANLGLKY